MPVPIAQLIMTATAADAGGGDSDTAVVSPDADATMMSGRRMNALL
jgi:hypothetical protein